MHSSIRSQHVCAKSRNGISHSDVHAKVTRVNPIAEEHIRIHSQSTSINAAFLHEIKVDDMRLKRLLAHLKTFGKIRPFGLNRLPSLAKLLGDFRDQLAFHFTLEEAYGFFDDAIEEAPQISRKVTLLKYQHVQLFDRACSLAAKAEEIAGESPCLRAVARLRRDIRALLARLQEHERAENRLIMDVLNVDLGVGD